MKKLNIGLLIVSDEWGGAQEMVYQLVKHLAQYRINLKLFVNDELKGYYDDIKGLFIYTLGSTNNKNKYFNLYSYYKMRRNLIKHLKTQPLDIVHIHLGGSVCVSFGLPDKFKIPALLTLHGSEIKNFFERVSLLDYWLLKKTFEKAKVVISPSHWQIQNLEKKYKIKTIIIPNGVDTKEFRRVKVKKETNSILFVGRFVELKGILELMEVAKLLPLYKFWFVGCGPFTKFINLPNTENLGFKTRKELIELYNRATICCFPSHYEAFGIACLEAMACGKPVIATKLGFSEFIENNKDGLIIEAKNVKQLKKSIVRLIKTPQLRTYLGRNAREKALKFDWQEIVKEYFDLYEATISKNNFSIRS